MRLTRQQKQELKTLKKQGYKLREISEKTGVSMATISYHTQRVKVVSAQTKDIPETKNYKDLYYRALAILLENQLIDVELT